MSFFNVPPSTRAILIAVGASLLFLVGIMLWSWQSRRASHEQANVPPQAAAAQSAARRPLTEEEEVRATLVLLWPIAREVDAADWRWAGCSDHNPGFGAVRGCLAGALAEVQEASNDMRKLRVATTCGLAVEKAHRDYVDGRLRYLRDELAWLDRNEAKLRGPLGSAPLSKVWSPDKTYAGSRPIGIDEKYTSGLLVITQNACIKRFLNCPALGCDSGRLNRGAGLRE